MLTAKSVGSRGLPTQSALHPTVPTFRRNGCDVSCGFPMVSSGVSVFRLPTKHGQLQSTSERHQRRSEIIDDVPRISTVMIFNSASCVASVLPLREKGLAKRSLQSPAGHHRHEFCERCVAPPQLPSLLVKLQTTFLGANVCQAVEVCERGYSLRYLTLVSDNTESEWTDAVIDLVCSCTNIC